MRLRGSDKLQTRSRTSSRSWNLQSHAGSPGNQQKKSRDCLDSARDQQKNQQIVTIQKQINELKESCKVTLTQLQEASDKSNHH